MRHGEIKYSVLTTQKQYDINLHHMASSPERPISQPLTKDAKDRLGNFQHSLLRKNHVPTEAKDWGTFEIINGYLNFLHTPSIPSTWSEQFNLQSLKWRNVSGHALLPRLLIGKSFGGNSETTEIDSASSTIEISQRIELVDGIAKIIPFHLRIAGVDKEQNRIVAVTYELGGDSNRLAELNVSVPQDEYEDLKKNLSAIYVAKTLASIPTSKDNPYRTAGLITEAMRRKTHHDNVLKLKFNNGSSVFEPLGYSIEREGEIVTVGIREDVAKARDLTPWKISVPAALPKA